MSWILITLIVIIGIIVVSLLGAYLSGRVRGPQKVRAQRKIFEMAQRKARETGKLLLVIGDPCPPWSNNYFWGAGYEGGDICIDANGAPTANGDESCKVQGWLPECLRHIPNNSVVIFESEVIIYIPHDKIALAMFEFKRISGGDIYACHSLLINAENYVTSQGQLQPIRLFDVWIGQNFGPTVRGAIAYPPFHPEYQFIEYAGKYPVTRELIMSYYGGGTAEKEQEAATKEQQSIFNVTMPKSWSHEKRNQIIQWFPLAGLIAGGKTQGSSQMTDAELVAGGKTQGSSLMTDTGLQGKT